MVALAFSFDSLSCFCEELRPSVLTPRCCGAQGAVRCFDVPTQEPRLHFEHVAGHGIIVVTAAARWRRSSDSSSTISAVAVAGPSRGAAGRGGTAT